MNFSGTGTQKDQLTKTKKSSMQRSRYSGLE